MTRRSEYKSLIPLLLTVPMLFVIGTVLSALAICFPAVRGFFAVFAVLCLIALALCVEALVLGIRREREVRRNEEIRDRFLSDAAHELKTPLTVIRGAGEVLLDGAVPPERWGEYAGRILEQTGIMNRLVSDLLDVSRMKSGKVRMELRDTDLASVAASVVEMLSDLAEEKKITLRCVAKDPLPVLLLDPDRIRQLAVIFTDNALKHTPEGGTVTLTTGAAGETCYLSVQDTGDGIAPEDLPYVFDRFYKADPSRGGLSSGSGVGLSIARQIAELHGGSVDVQSRPGEGSCFTARLLLHPYKEDS